MMYDRDMIKEEGGTAEHPRLRLSRRRLLLMGAGCGLAGAGGYEYARNIEPAWLDVHPVQLALPRLAPEFDGYVIAQFSDIHMGDWMTQEQLRHIVMLVNQQRPDLIVVSGDFVTFSPRQQMPPLVTELSRLAARDGVVSVLGNHDYWTDPFVIRQVIHDSGMIDLSNAVHTLVRGNAQLHIAGVDDVWEQLARLDVVLAALPKDGAAILIAHEPDFADASAASGRFDLQISGHTHGGQINLPLYGPVQLPPYGKRYVSGLYRVGTMYQYTNRGVGLVNLPFRINCRPEITVFTLRASRP